MQTAVIAAPHLSGGNDAPQMYIQLAAAPPTHVRYPKTLCICLGTAQMVIGLFCISFNIVSIVFIKTSNVPYGFAYVGHGIWCGALFFATGSIGVASGHRKTKCKIVTYNVMSIISAAFTSGLLVCGIIGAVITSYNTNYCNRYSSISDSCYMVQVVVTMESFLAVFAIIEAVLFILTSTICCKHGGCGNCCSDIERPVLLPIVCQQSAGQPSQGIQLTYVLPSTTLLQEGPTTADSSTRPSFDQSQSTTSVAPLYPSAPGVDSYSRATAIHPPADDGQVYDNYGIY